MTAHASLADVLGVPVRVRDLRIGEVSGVFLDRPGGKAIGLEVSIAGGVRRFLPWVAAKIERGSVRVQSTLLLVDAGDSYERRGAVAVHDRSELAAVSVTEVGDLRLDETTPAAVSAMPPVGR